MLERNGGHASIFWLYQCYVGSSGFWKWPSSHSTVRSNPFAEWYLIVFSECVNFEGGIWSVSPV